MDWEVRRSNEINEDVSVVRLSSTICTFYQIKFNRVWIISLWNNTGWYDKRGSCRFVEWYCWIIDNHEAVTKFSSKVVCDNRILAYLFFCSIHGSYTATLGGMSWVGWSERNEGRAIQWRGVHEASPKWCYVTVSTLINVPFTPPKWWICLWLKIHDR